jgi:hypothetical protein
MTAFANLTAALSRRVASGKWSDWSVARTSIHCV